MSGDYSRNTFDPKRHFSGVLMQQGRVQLDADWNELVEIIDRRWRAETTDIIGRAVVPKETPDGFKIQITGGTLAIGRGRMYVHGLLAENHGEEPWEFDSILAEEHGTVPILYTNQPYFPNTPALPGGGPHLVYLDVWQREATYLEKPELIEKAVGVDTTNRQQTVWQVKVLPNVGATVTCATPDDQIPGWLEQTQPSAGRLTTAAVGVPSTDDPCLIPPTGGYKGLENQLYRIEIHEKGVPGTATFKWSRDNATVATAVTAIPALDTLTIVRTGRDSILRFNPGDWLEITDDWREFAGLPGEMRKIDSVEDATRTITLTAPLPAGAFPTDAQGQTDPARHTRIRRWDQNGKERDTTGNPVVDLDTTGGVIPVPAVGTPIVLENGVQITFSTDPTGGNFRVGDYWIFAARTADASVELLDKAPPRGIHHHYCRLALLTFPNNVTDCRVLWPPDVSGEGCDCSVCVTADSHNSGTLTIQRAVDQVKDTGGTVCLGPGLYNLGENPIRIVGAQSVRLKGQSWKTLLVYTSPGSAVIIENSQGVTMEEMTILTSVVSAEASPGVVLRNCLGVTFQRCIVLQRGSQEHGGPAIGLEGYLFGVFIRENALVASTGIASMIGEREAGASYLFTAGFYVQDNLLWCERRGISLERSSLHFAETRLSGNFVNGCSQHGILAVGVVFPGSDLDVHGNELYTRGDGIVIGTDEARVSNNDISAAAAGRGGDGIVLVPGLDRTGIDRCQVLGNRVTGIAGHGIALRTHVRSATIKQNVIEAIGGGGIVMEDKSGADGLSIENNQLLHIAPQANDPQKSVVGIRLLNTIQAGVVSNTIRRVGQAAVQSPNRAGIQIIGSSSVRIAGNELVDIGPADEFVKESVGVEVLASFEHVDVVDNVIRRSQHPPSGPSPSNWYALRIRGPVADFLAVDDNIGVASFGDSMLGFFGNRLLVLPRGREMVAVRGNLLEASGDVPAVDIAGGGALVFSDNRCLLASRVRPPVTDIATGALIASGNYLQGPQEAVAMTVQVPQGQFTVLGNIASGQVRVNDQSLPDPWAPLNVAP